MRTTLDELVRVPSISAPGHDPARVRETAEITLAALKRRGAVARIVETDGTHPTVVGRIDGPLNAPSVLLYAHHDIQPPGARDRWRSDPFEPIERDGRLYGRGAADDKGGIALHLAAIDAHGGRPPVSVAFVIDGEEEIGSPHVAACLDREAELLRCDVAIVADSANWRIGRPALTMSLRGVVTMTVEVRVLDHAVHSGAFGGVVPDAMMVMSRLLASLHDDEGCVAVRGLATFDSDPLDLTEGEIRRYVAARPTLSLIGHGSLTSRLWTQPAISIVGVDATPVSEVSPTISPVARARISMRIPHGQDPSAAEEALRSHLLSHAPWGAEVAITGARAGAAYKAPTNGGAVDAFRDALHAAWGTKVTDIGQGGSIPIVHHLSREFPEATLIITGVADPESNAHAENESLHLGEFERACVAEALFMALLGSASSQGEARER